MVDMRHDETVAGTSVPGSEVIEDFRVAFSLAMKTFLCQNWWLNGGNKIYIYSINIYLLLQLKCSLSMHVILGDCD